MLQAWEFQCILSFELNTLYIAAAYCPVVMANEAELSDIDSYVAECCMQQKEAVIVKPISCSSLGGFELALFGGLYPKIRRGALPTLRACG